MIGQTLAHYRILEKIGGGGMGVVYRARDTRLGRDVALKLLPAEAVGDAAGRQRLEHEARTASALNHPNICTIFDVGEAKGHVYLAMEFVAGQPLSRSISLDGLPDANVARIGVQLADALEHAHQQGIIHRDLKSANVMLTSQGRAKILDFGLAIRKHEDLDEETKSRGSLADVGGISGTLSYMAPEVLRGQQADARSDLWALGVVLYEMASGNLPFRGQTGFDLSSSILRDVTPPLPERVSASLSGIIRRCLEKEPGLRYQRAGEVRAALEAIGLSTSSTTGAQAPPARSAHRTVLLTVAAIMVVAAFLVAFNVGGARDGLLGRPGTSEILGEKERVIRETTAKPKSASEQADLAMKYEQGRGQTQDDAEAAKWYQKAAEQGVADAQYRLGVLYANGRGVPQNDATAASWFRRAAEQGHAVAQSNLGIMYLAGVGVSKDGSAALKWVQRAVGQGNAAAQYTLGMMYLEGHSVAKDDIEALIWIRKAAEQGYPGAQFMLGKMYEKGYGVSKDDAVAKMWLRKVEEQVAKVEKEGKTTSPAPARPATIYGVIDVRATDTRGRGIPYVSVTVNNTATGRTYTGSTDRDGQFRFPELPPGVYSVLFEMEELQSVKHTPVLVSVNRVTREEAVLRPSPPPSPRKK